MARVWMTGFETGDATNGNTEFGGGTLTNFSFDTTNVNPGGSVRSGKFTSSGSILGMAGSIPNGELSLRLYVYIDAVPTSRVTLIKLLDSTQASDFALCINTDQTLSVVDTNGSLSSHTAGTVSVSGWHLIEANASIGTTAEIWIDGEDQGLMTGLNFGAKVRDHVSIGPSDFIPGCNVWIDDIALNDQTGTNNKVTATNQRVGPGSIIMIVPGADITPNNWTIQGGGATHFGCLNELPGTVDDVHYINSTSATSGLADAWSFTATPSGLDSYAIVNAIHWGVRGGGSGTQATGREALFRATDSGGNTITSARKNWGVNGFLTVYPFLKADLTWDGTNSFLSKTYVDGVNGRMIDDNNSTREVRCSTVWANVDYIIPTTIMQPAHGMMYPVVVKFE